MNKKGKICGYFNKLLCELYLPDFVWLSILLGNGNASRWVYQFEGKYDQQCPWTKTSTWTCLQQRFFVSLLKLGSDYFQSIWIRKCAPDVWCPHWNNKYHIRIEKLWNILFLSFQDLANALGPWFWTKLSIFTVFVPYLKKFLNPFCFACTLGHLPCLCLLPYLSTKLNEYS